MTSGGCAPAPRRCHSQSKDESRCPKPWECQHRVWPRCRGGLEQGVDGDEDHQPNLQPLVHAAVQVSRLCARLIRQVPHFGCTSMQSFKSDHLTLATSRIGMYEGSSNTAHTGKLDRAHSVYPSHELQAIGLCCMINVPEEQRRPRLRSPSQLPGCGRGARGACHAALPLGQTESWLPGTAGHVSRALKSSFTVHTHASLYGSD